MKRLDKFTIAFFLAVFATTNCQNLEQPASTKVVGLTDPKVDSTVKAALQNGTVSEVVVRKDLFLFPVNAPDLVIAHRQEVHALPRNDTNDADGKPSAAEVAEVNEYSLSQLVPTNDSAATNGMGQSISVPVSTISAPSNAKNDSVLEPGKLLEIASGFNLSDGLSTQKVSLPDQVQNMNIPKQSLSDLLSKSLGQTNGSLTTVNSPHVIGTRSVDSSHFDTADSCNTTDDGNSGGVDIVKRSNDESQWSNGSSSSSTTSRPVEGNANDLNVAKRFDVDASNPKSNDFNNTGTEPSESSGSKVVKRSIDSDESESRSDESENTSESSEEGQATSGVGTILLMKRSVDPENANHQDDDSSNSESDDSDDDGYPYFFKRSTEVLKDVDNDGKSLDDGNNFSSNAEEDSLSNKNPIKRSVDSDEDENGSFITMESHGDDDEVEKHSKKLNPSSDELSISKIHRREKKNDKADSEEDMDVAEDIVFRPLFRYREETRLRQQDAPNINRQSSRREFKNKAYSNRYRYETDDSDYD